MRTDLADRIVDAMLPDVPFDGWSERAFRRAVAAEGLAPAEARRALPRGALDAALRFHERGDELMVERLRAEDLEPMRYRDRVAHAVRVRLEIAGAHPEAVRRGATLLALPVHAGEGLRAGWRTADAIWEALGDRSDDVNWYTKRATLQGVYAATLLFWLGDHSEGHRDTWSFLDRRIDDVMRIEKAKAQVRASPALSRLFAGPAALLAKVRAPGRMPRGDLPGYWAPPAAPPTAEAAPEAAATPSVAPASPIPPRPAD
ncbi:COQ9 family protein [Jannaschia sp. W003]|uniref:COQ9 family protein n=1 Tax=Jannaschia sp. W003 TaxID=2867012 RepID=UPI0021A96371|nr:COQ9 family protein [Jannaschia sp. W003]UWQ22725.1 COQ9 family protein [Jannaschia sp. W003]